MSEIKNSGSFQATYLAAEFARSSFEFKNINLQPARDKADRIVDVRGGSAFQVIVPHDFNPGVFKAYGVAEITPTYICEVPAGYRAYLIPAASFSAEMQEPLTLIGEMEVRVKKAEKDFGVTEGTVTAMDYVDGHYTFFSPSAISRKTIAAALGFGEFVAKDVVKGSNTLRKVEASIIKRALRSLEPQQPEKDAGSLRFEAPVEPTTPKDAAERRGQFQAPLPPQ